MDFFEHQSNARRQTGRLLVFFLAAVGLTVLALDVGFFWLGRVLHVSLQGSPLWHEWSPQVLAGVLLLVGGGSLKEYLLLRGGGQALARSLGARRIDFSTTEPKERQYLNVVAEMAIASGVPAPTLYVLDREPGINAFVAGLTHEQTVMVVTGGALQVFDRDELQAVVGHEFSHILNGDMRLNLRLLALLAGILAIGQAGGFLMRLASNTDTLTAQPGRRDRKGGVIYLFLVGLLLWLIGYIGLFFGRLIKAAISRQREFLADASSVQFTRNPDGLASALFKIRDHVTASWLQGLYAENMSHMCFAETLNLSSWFDTHPPLELRVAALGRSYLARDRARQRDLQRQAQTAAEVAAARGLPMASRPEAALTSAAFAGASGAAVAPVRELPPIPFPGLAEEEAALSLPQAATRLVARAGTVNPAELASAQALLSRLPPAALQALETSDGTQALLLALVARHCSAPAAELQSCLAEVAGDLAQRAQLLYRLLDGLDLCFSLPLVELALPRLQLLPATAQREYMERLQRLARLDSRITTFEFALLMLLRKQLQLLPKPRPVRLAQCAPAVALLVASLLRTGGMDEATLPRVFSRLLRTLCNPPPALPAAGDTGLGRLGRTLYVLGGLPLVDKKALLELAATAVLADAEVRINEYELLRVVAALLDCPMPVLEA